MGATVVGTVPDYSAGAFGMAVLAEETLRERLEPSLGQRPGRPSNPAWSKRPKVPRAPETEQRLGERLRQSAKRWGAAGSPMQVAALILEQATASYFRSVAP